MSDSFLRPVPTIGDTTSAQARQSSPEGWAMDAPTREAMYLVMDARRDIRRYRPDPIPESTIRKVIEAGHHGPSVGHSQPWRFILVYDEDIRERACVMADQCRIRQASLLDDAARRNLLDLQLEGIREAPIGIVVACDRRSPHQGILGRATFPDADMWSCAAAIENMWLAARAEGLGMGWVTLFEPDELRNLLHIPEGVETLGWLCLGWPDERPPAPGLERRGWSKRMPLDEVMMTNRWPEGDMAPPAHRLRADAPIATAVTPAAHPATTLATAKGDPVSSPTAQSSAAKRVPEGLVTKWGLDIALPSRSNVVAARDQSDRLLTPPGSLGLIDQIVDRALSVSPTACDQATLVLAGADHKVTSYGVSAFDPQVTKDVMDASVQHIALGTALAKTQGFEIRVVDAGVNTPVEGAIPIRPADPVGDLCTQDGLSLADTYRLVEEGIALGKDLPDGMVCLGEVGVGNTTVASALAAVLLGLDAKACVGLGAGSDTTMTETKLAVVTRILDRLAPVLADPEADIFHLLAGAGGPEFCVLTGVILGAVSTGKVVVVDGLATTMSAIVAERIAPAAQAYMVSAHRSREQVHAEALRELGLEPIGDWRLRAGEGAGAVMAATVLRQVATARRVTATTTDPALLGS